MDDTTLITLITTLFALNFGATWAVYRRVNSFSTALSILCREHAKNHGNTEIHL